MKMTMTTILLIAVDVSLFLSIEYFVAVPVCGRINRDDYFLV